MGEFKLIEISGRPARLYSAGDFASGTPGVILFHAWWGLNDDATAYADRLAAAGFSVIAPDMFGGQVASTIDAAKALAGAAEEEPINAIALAAVDQLADRLSATSKLAAVGFSFGAHWSMWCPTQRDSVVASILYYGTTGDSLTQSAVPVLGHFAEHDPYETDEWVGEFAQTLRTAGRDVVIHHYPDTGHWFAEPSKDAYCAVAADLAFDRTVEFLNKQTRTC